MLDRIDIHIEVPRVDFEKLSNNRRREASDEIRARVEQSRQRVRFAGLNNGVMTNTDMRVVKVQQSCELDDAGQTLIEAAMPQFQLSAQAYHRYIIVRGALVWQGNLQVEKGIAIFRNLCLEW